MWQKLQTILSSMWTFHKFKILLAGNAQVILPFPIIGSSGRME